MARKNIVHIFTPSPPPASILRTVNWIPPFLQRSTIILWNFIGMGMLYSNSSLEIFLYSIQNQLQNGRWIQYKDEHFGVKFWGIIIVFADYTTEKVPRRVSVAVFLPRYFPYGHFHQTLRKFQLIILNRNLTGKINKANHRIIFISTLG